MPTKHKRKYTDDNSHYDLPPSTKAKPLPVIAPTKDFLVPRKRQRVEQPKKRKNVADDTPKKFARLMAWTQQGKKLGGGLDNGRTSSDKSKKQKKKQQNLASAETPQNVTTAESSIRAAQIPKILPGETLTEFAIRVDQSMPLSTMTRTGAPTSSLPEDLRLKEKASQRLTKHNKRLARMQADWRATDARLRAKEEEELEDNEEKLEEEKLLWENVKSGKRRKKGAKVVEDNPWKALEKKKRAATKQKSVRDVVQEPPQLPNIKNMFKVGENADLKPTTTPAVARSNVGVGGQRRQRKRDELEEVRRAAIEAARRQNMNSQRRAVAV